VERRARNVRRSNKLVAMRDEWSPLRLTTEQRMPAALGTILLLAYAATTLYVGLHHEPSRLEADGWLLANNGSLTDIVHWTRNAGTPALWILVLKPLAWMHLPYVSQTLLNLTIAWAAAAILIFFGPLTRLTKLLLLASYHFAYDYSIVAGSDALAILLLFVALAMLDRPIAFAIAVALLFNTNVHGGVIATALLFIFLIRKPRDRTMAVPVAVMLAGALAAFAQIGLHGNRATINPNPGWMTAIDIFMLLSIAIAIRHSRRAVLLLVEILVGLAMIDMAFGFGGLRDAELILVAAIAAIWVAAAVPLSVASRIAALLLNVTLIASAAYAFQNASADIRFAFSGSKEMAQFIDARFDDHAIAAHNLAQTEAILPYLPGRRFWYIGAGEYGTFLKWDDAQRLGATMPFEIAAERARRHFRGQKWLLVTSAPIPQPQRLRLRLIHATTEAVFGQRDERYWLYVPVP
jgi:hypothetical protein